MHALIKKIPIPTGGLALGLASLGILLKQSILLYIFFGLTSLICIVLLAARACIDLPGIRKEMENPVVAAVSAATFMAIMQLTTYLAPFAYSLAFTIWVCAIIGHLVVMTYFTLKFVSQRKLNVYTPTAFVCYVGIIMASLTSPTYNMQTIGSIFFWFGFMFYAILLLVVTLRYIRIPIPEPARPTFCIYAAPMSLSLAGYFATAETISTAFIILLEVLAQIFLLIALTRIPAFMKLKFYPSFAAMTFPFVITASALRKTITYLTGVGMAVPTIVSALSVLEVLLAIFMVVFVLVHYCMFFSKEYRASTQACTAIENV